MAMQVFGHFYSEVDPKGDGKVGYLRAPARNGNYNGNSPVKRSFTISGRQGKLLRDIINVEEGYRGIKKATLEWDVINVASNPDYTITCDGVQRTIDKSKGLTHTAEVTVDVEAFAVEANDKLFDCTFDGSVVVASKQQGLFNAPRIKIENRDFIVTSPHVSHNFHVVSAADSTHPTAQMLLYPHNISYYSAGVCVDADSIDFIFPAQPSSCEQAIGAMHEFVEQLEVGEKRCIRCVDASGMGYTQKLNGNPTVASPPADVWRNARASAQLAYEQLVRPVSTHRTTVGLEWSQRLAVHLVLENPGEITDIFMGTPSYQPIPDEYQSACTYVAPGEGETIFSSALAAAGVAAGFTQELGNIPCSPDGIVKWASIMGCDGLADPQFCGDNAIYSALGLGSKFGPLPQNLAGVQNVPGEYNPGAHTEFDFSQYLACDAGCDPILGAGAGFNLRCGAKMGPGGFGTARGQNQMFAIRHYSDEEYARLDAPYIFPDFGVDPTAACGSATPGAPGPSLMPQPDVAQMFAATARTDPNEPHPTVWGTLPGDMEVVQVREDHDMAVQAMFDGTFQNALLGGAYLFLSDQSHGILTGDSTIDALPLMPWIDGQVHATIFPAVNVTLKSVSKCGNHMDTLMSQPYLASAHLLDAARA